MGPITETSRGDAIDVLVGLLSELEQGGDRRAFFDRICEALCRLTSLERSGLILYDPARHLARAVGSHGLDRDMIDKVEATIDEAPMVQRALSEDRVVAVSENLEDHLPARYARFAGITTIVCGPVAAGGRWFGVLFADRGGGRFELDSDEEQTMLAMGRMAALAATVESSTRRQERASRLDERIALVREVHESVIQRLFGLSLALGADQPLTAEERARCAEELQAVLTQLRIALGRALTPQEFHTETTLADMLEHRARDPEVEVAWPDDAVVPEHLEALAQSVVIEALRNADRHSSATRTEVRVGGSREAFELEVTNDGVGTGERRGPRGTGLGLRILTLEALQHNGLIEFGPVDGGGWRVRLLVPIADE